MSREIKFRAWCPITKKMFANKDTLRWIAEMLEIKNYQVMQFTGLHDVNGVEIYEGDIVRCKERNLLWVVSFYKSCFTAHDPENEYDFALITDYTFAVIGNIHQNPELLK